MRVVRTLADLRYTLANLPRPLALIPTMGGLHAGHLALLAGARDAGANSVVTSIFVNPLQFNNQDDLARYPRTEASDLAALESNACDVTWIPSVETMYAPGACSFIEVTGPSQGFEGDIRPGHFRGMATVVGKLFNQTGAQIAMFGEKDWQQLQVVNRMVRDLDFPLRIVAVPTVREADGLAMSSRNRFLTPNERLRAPLLYAVLHAAATALVAGSATAVDEATERLRTAGLRVEYLAVVEADTMIPLPSDVLRLGPVQTGAARLVAAVRLGTVRLLDNVAVGTRGAPTGSS